MHMFDIFWKSVFSHEYFFLLKNCNIYMQSMNHLLGNSDMTGSWFGLYIEILNTSLSFRFLWRQNATFAISRHYKRYDVFEEAEANRAAGKYDNVSIDRQIEFYRKEGLKPYSKAKLPITSGRLYKRLYVKPAYMCFNTFLDILSIAKYEVLLLWLSTDVPEGCVIIREHIAMTNLFTCLWFNEVDRFTSRDQLSFSTVRDKVMERVSWSINMFMDCERRNFVLQVRVFIYYMCWIG